MNFSSSNLHKNDQSIMFRSTDPDFSRIEELIKENTFSREEISYLVEILSSRVDNELEKQKSDVIARRNTELVSLTQEIQRTPAERKQQDTDRTMIDAFHEESNVPVGASASPIDIARAYMAGRTSERGHDIYSSMSKGERTQPSIEFARTPLLPPPSLKPLICWPGSTVHDRLGYETPHSQRARHRIYDFPRTPYSRTTLSKSTTKSQADRGYANISTPFQQSQATIYGQVNLRGDPVDGYASVGPIRRIRNKFASEVRPRNSIYLSSPKDSPSKMVKPKVFGGFSPATEKNLEPGETSGASKYLSGDNVSGSSGQVIPNPNSSSSQAVRKILEHLDRNKPTPKEKESEMKLATTWKRSPFETNNTYSEENVNLLRSRKLDSQKNTDITGPKSDSTFDNLVNFHEKGMDESKGVVNGNTKASSAVFSGSTMTPGANALPSFGSKGTSGGPAVKDFGENAFNSSNHGFTGTSLLFSSPHVKNGPVANPTSSELSKNQGNKPSMPSISINKPDFCTASKDNGPTFTFPVSASSGILSEPPTPSITPSFSASILSQPVGGVPTVPSYSFGTNSSTPRLVFSFPSTSSASTNDESDIKFGFGSDKKTRLSFSSLGKDGICY